MKHRFIDAALYTRTKLVWDRTVGEYVIMGADTPYLYSGGTRPTKIRPCDLPDYYVETGMGFLKAKGIVDMVHDIYPVSDKILWDDVLYVSYSKSLDRSPEGRNRILNRADLVVTRDDILPFLLKVMELGEYDVTGIREKFAKRLKRLNAENPASYRRELNRFNPVIRFLGGDLDG